MTISVRLFLAALALLFVASAAQAQGVVTGGMRTAKPVDLKKIAAEVKKEDQRAICGTINSRVIQTKEEMVIGGNTSYGTYDVSIVAFTDGRWLQVVSSTPIEITLEPGKLYSFTVRKNAFQNGWHLLLKTEAANVCGYVSADE